MGLALGSTVGQPQQTEERLATRTRELSNRRRRNRLSDDPSASANAIVQRGEISRIDSYVKATDSVESRLSMVDSMLSDMIIQIAAAQTAAAVARSTVTPAAQREALATQVEEIRDTILTDVTTQYQGSYLFSGAATTTAPYKQSGSSVSAYQGDATEVHVDVGQSTAIKVSMNGDELLRGTDPTDLFVALELLAAEVRAGDMAGIDAGHQALERACDRATEIQSALRDSLRLIGELRLDLSARRVDSIERLARHEDADLAQSMTALPPFPAGLPRSATG